MEKPLSGHLGCQNLADGAAALGSACELRLIWGVIDERPHVVLACFQVERRLAVRFSKACSSGERPIGCLQRHAGDRRYCDGRAGRNVRPAVAAA